MSDAFANTPTTTFHGAGGEPGAALANRNRRPSGLAVGHSCCASDWLTMTSPRCLELASNERPAMNRIFIIPKYSGRTEFIVVKPPRSGAECGAVPSATHEPIITLVRVGTLSATVTCSTPGNR